jgi:hypothetical protein
MKPNSSLILSTTLTWAVSLFCFLSCATEEKVINEFGMNPKKIGYIPARMALFNCQLWPDQATRLGWLPLRPMPEKEWQSLCSDYDQFLLSGFDNQPFMKGLVPSYTEKLYGAAATTPVLKQVLPQYWKHQTGDCSSCTELSSFYLKSISGRKDWQLWLNNFSHATLGADAILIPLLVYYAKYNTTDRGMAIARREAEIHLILVDTATGELIWSGLRRAEVVNKSFSEDPKAGKLEPPSAEDLKMRLFTEALWYGFPGRQVYK